MAGIPQFDETQPVLSHTSISSDASGYEAFAKTLGSIAQVSGKVVETATKEKSNAMYLSSMANLEQLKTSTQSLFLTDPANAAKHAETFQKSVDEVVGSSFVNSADRAKLKYYSGRFIDQADLEATKTEVKQGQIAASFEHYKNWPFQLKMIRDAAMDQDPAKLESAMESVQSHIKELVLTGSMTPLQGGAALESMNDQVSLAHDVMDIAHSLDKHSAANFHTAMSNPMEPNHAQNVNYPADENTKWMTNYHLQDRTFQGVQDGIYDHKFDVEAYESLTPHQRAQVKSEVNGIRIADGMIDSNTSLSAIKSRLKELEGRESFEAVAERKTLKSYVTDVESGDSEALMARTTLGGQIVQNYVQKSSYLDDRLRGTDPANTGEIASLTAELAKTKNDYVNQSVAYAQAHHWPVVSPIPHQDISIIQNGFSIKGDPSANVANAYRTFSQYSKQNQIYVAEQMKDPKQRAVMQTLAYGNHTQAEQMDFMAANQDRKYREMDLSTNQTSEAYLKNQINTQLSSAFKIIQSQNDPINATLLNANILQASVNYAKYLSEKKGEFTMQKDGWIDTFNSSGNIGEVSKFINNAYEPLTGANYVVNKKQVNLDNDTMSGVAQYAIDRGNDYLRAHMSEAEFIQFQRQSQLTVTVTPTNVLIAQDANGNIAYSEPYTGDLVAHATAETKRIKDEKIKAAEKQFKKYNMVLSPEEQWIKLNPEQENKPSVNGMVEAGNIDLKKRPVIQNEDGTHSTVRTITIEEEGETVLIPTAINGKIVSNKEAIAHYRKTGEHMGKFKSEEAAEKYDKKIHKEMGWTK